MECQYNQYVCREHIDYLEPLLVIEGAKRGHTIESFSIYEEPEDD